MNNQNDINSSGMEDHDGVKIPVAAPETPHAAKTSSVSDKPLPEVTLANIRFRPLFVRFLLILYFVTVIAFGYWYWMRPVRADQFKDAHEKWRAVAKIFHVPVPKDERWGW
jgi:hypothetical protein